MNKIITEICIVLLFNMENVLEVLLFLSCEQN